ncbi:MAG: hypothetical protein M3Y32_08665 [Pseudomonadota bacterium]|nr:hypothetical protein [Pseudomonadota bacterium]
MQAALVAAATASFTAWLIGWVAVLAGVATRWNSLVTAAVSLGVALGLGWWRWRATRASDAIELSWDGQRWRLDGVAGEVDVMIDLERWLLLRLQPEAGGPRRWAAFGAAEVGGAWHGLRAAAHARRPLAVAVE